jgi:hypothetical protein
MVMKNTFIALLVLSLVLITQAHAMNQIPQLSFDHGQIEGAAFYTIHGFKNLAKYAVPANAQWNCDYAIDPTITIYEGAHCIHATRGCASLPYHGCTARDLIDHNQASLTVTFYDENRSIIAWMDLTMLNMQKSVTVSNNSPIVSTAYVLGSYEKLRNYELTLIHQYCREKLDSSIKLKALSVSINNICNWDNPYLVIFYGHDGNIIGEFKYSTKPNFDESSHYGFEDYIDFVGSAKNRDVVDLTCANSCSLF